MINDLISKLIIILIPLVVFLSSGGVLLVWLFHNKDNNVGILSKISKSLWSHYKEFILFSLLIFLFFGFFVNWLFALVFLLGIILAGKAVILAMLVKIERESEVDKKRGKNLLGLSFKNSFILSFCLTSASLLLISILYFLMHTPLVLIGLVFGVSLFTLFTCLKGGVEDYIKRVLDFLDIYILGLVGVILLGFFIGTGKEKEILAYFPLIINSLALAASALSISFLWFLRSILIKHKLGKMLLSIWIFGCVVLSLIFFTPAISYLISQISVEYNFFLVFEPILFAFLAVAVVFAVAKYYLSREGEAVRQIARLAERDAWEGVMKSFSAGARSTFLLMAVLLALIWGAYQILNVYGIALSALGAISLLPLTLTVYVYGFFRDMGIEGARKISKTRRMETAGYSLFSTILVLLVIFIVYIKGVAEISGKFFIFDLAYLQVLGGLFLGGMFIYIFVSYILENEGRIKKNFVKILSFLLLPLAFIIFTYFVLGIRGLGGLLAGTIIAGSYLAITLTFSQNIWQKAGGAGDGEKIDILPIMGSMMRIVGIMSLIMMLFL